MSVDEAPLEDADGGKVPAGDGWFILNARTRSGSTATSARTRRSRETTGYRDGWLGE